MEIVTTETLPPEASMAGTNTCYCHCQALNKRSNYGVCLFTLKAFEESKLREDSDCHAVINSGNCEARRYRQQERDAGRALFFKQRSIAVKVVESTERPSFDRDSDSFKRGWARAGSSPKPVTATRPSVAAQPKPVERKKGPLEFSGTLADAVTAAMQQETPKPAPESKPDNKQPESPTINPVKSTKPMSLLERARLAMSK